MESLRGGLTNPMMQGIAARQNRARRPGLSRDWDEIDSSDDRLPHVAPGEPPRGLLANPMTTT